MLIMLLFSEKFNQNFYLPLLEPLRLPESELPEDRLVELDELLELLLSELDDELLETLLRPESDDELLETLLSDLELDDALLETLPEEDERLLDDEPLLTLDSLLPVEPELGAVYSLLLLLLELELERLYSRLPLLLFELGRVASLRLLDSEEERLLVASLVLLLEASEFTLELVRPLGVEVLEEEALSLRLLLDRANSLLDVAVSRENAYFRSIVGAERG
jgi:hypothetical protein